MLRDLLVQAIDVCAAWIGRDPDRDGVVHNTLWGQRLSA
jgi:hypothetical protein